MDAILVGDSLAMVALGMEDTNEVVMEEMLLHCRSVARAARSAFTVSFDRALGADRGGNVWLIGLVVFSLRIFPWVRMRFPPSRHFSLLSAL